MIIERWFVISSLLITNVLESFRYVYVPIYIFFFFYLFITRFKYNIRAFEIF